MSTMSFCRACKWRHDPLILCSRAERMGAREPAGVQLGGVDPVAGKALLTKAVAVCVTDKPVTDTKSGNGRGAAKQAAYRARKGEVGKQADAARKRASRAKAKLGANP